MGETDACAGARLAVLRFVTWRAIETLPVIVGVSIITWAMVALAPGDPSRIYAAQFAESGRPTAEEVERARSDLGLDGTAVDQYLVWAGKTIRGDLGRSFTTGAPVVDELQRRVWPTLQLAIGALVIMVAVGIPLGVLAALHRNTWIDAAARIVSLSSGAAPAFVVALVLIWLFAVVLGWLPSLGAGGPSHMVLPSIALATTGVGTFTRLMRASMLDVLSQPYLMAARSRGISESRLVIRHALRNALIPIITQMGLTIGILLGGTAIVETIFAWPGIGKLAIDAIDGRDYPVLQAVVLTSAIVYVVANLMVDLTYRIADPRLEPGGS